MKADDIWFMIFFITLCGIIMIPAIYLIFSKKNDRKFFYKNETPKIDKTNCYDCKCQYCDLKKYLDKEC
jgi:hypothetical protein